MKKIILCIASFILSIAISLSIAEYSRAEVCTDISEVEVLVGQYIECVNNQQIEEYIDLFTDEIREEMNEYLLTCGDEDFFAEKSRELISIQKEDEKYAVDEKEKYGEVIVVLVKEYIEYTEQELSANYFHESGIHENIYVYVKENDEWKLSRVSTSERECVPVYYEETDFDVNDEAMTTSTASISNPFTTTVYFTKNANYNYYGVRTKNITFSNYLSNVIPNEWTVSYFNMYPAYGYAGTMASKMYAWYYTVHPKWNFSPYNACLKDNSDDQNYLYNSFGTLATIYQGYENSALMYVDRLAMGL